MLGTWSPSLHRNKTEGEGLLTYCCFKFREVRFEMWSRSLNLYENARNLAGHRAEQDRAYYVAALRRVLYCDIEYLHHTLWSIKLFNYSIVIIRIIWLTIRITLYLIEVVVTVRTVYMWFNHVRLQGPRFALFVSKNSLPAGCPPC
jgi:hypothetical protein